MICVVACLDLPTELLINPDNTLAGAYLKIHRANDHIRSLIAHIQPLNPSFYTLGWRPPTSLPCAFSLAGASTDANAILREFAYVPRQPISQILALVIGDAVHNLRAALDYAATAVVRAMDGDTDHLYFPFKKEKLELVKKSCRSITALQKALPGVDVEYFFQNKIKSYSGSAEFLWELTKIDKIDKHNFILPTVSVARIEHDEDFSFGEYRLIMPKMSGDANIEQVIYRVDILSSDIKPYKIDVHVEVHFPEGGYFSKMSVVPVLVQLSETVLKTLRAFEEFAVGAGAPVRSRIDIPGFEAPQ